MINKLDWSLLDATVRRLQSDLSLAKAGDAFCRFVVSNILNITVEDAERSVVDGGNDLHVDAIHFDQSDSCPVLHIFNCRYKDTFTSAGKNFPGSEVSKLFSTCHDIINENSSIFKGCNPKLKAMLEYIWEHNKSPGFQVRIYICSNTAGASPHDRHRITGTFAELPYVSVVDYHLSTVVNDFIRRYDPKIVKDLKLYRKLSFRNDGSKVSGVIATVRATDYVEFIQCPSDPKRVHSALFHENVRVFLGFRNSVNRSILETITGENSAEFWYLNNGVTMVCEKIEGNITIPNAEICLNNVQIVNGGQTSYALHEAAQLQSTSLEDIFVKVKIYETSDPDVLLRIAEATNNQTAIQSKDLRANHKIQRKLEKEFAAHGYFYERKRNMFADKPADKKIDALRAGQCFLAYYKEEPDKAKTQSDRIFGELFSDIFDESITATRMLCPLQIMKMIEAEKMPAKRQSRLRLKGGEDNEFIIEGSFHVLYVVSLLCRRSGINCEDFSKSQDFVNEAIKITRDVSKAYRNISFYKFFRSAKAKELLKSAVFSGQGDLFHWQETS